MLYFLLFLAYTIFSFGYVLIEDSRRMAKHNAKLAEFDNWRDQEKWEREERDREDEYFRNEPLKAKLWRWFTHLPFGFLMLVVVLCYRGFMASLVVFWPIEWFRERRRNRGKSSFK